jgi:hypothetical protein
MRTATQYTPADLAREGRFKAALARFSMYSTYPIWNVPEYDDQQSFPVAGVFGPVAYVAPLPDLFTLKKAKDFETTDGFGELVALIVVDDTPPSGTNSYTALHLTAKGTYCVYLAHDDKAKEDDPGSWHGYIIPPASPTTCKSPTDKTGELSVQFLRNKIHTNDEDYPGVARFGYDDKGQALVYVRCGDSECVLGPGTFTLPPPLVDGYPVVSGKKEGRIGLWHDEQVLALAKQGGGAAPGTLRASVVPLEKINEHDGKSDFNDKWIPMAWIVLDQDPGTTKYGLNPKTGKGWGMHRGLNLLFLGYDTATKQWGMQIVQYGDDGLTTVGLPRNGRGQWHDRQGVAPPGSARFSWLANDEGVWVACDQGCCQVDADK